MVFPFIFAAVVVSSCPSLSSSVHTLAAKSRCCNRYTSRHECAWCRNDCSETSGEGTRDSFLKTECNHVHRTSP